MIPVGIRTGSAVEEIYVEARADDDFGLHTLDLVYSVNGGDARSVRLFNGETGALKEVSAGHNVLPRGSRPRAR